MNMIINAKKFSIVIALLILVAIVVLYIIIFRQVKYNCILAKNKYQQTCVNSLIELIKSNDFSTRQKNSAIWALGQIASKSSLTYLYELNDSLPKQSRCSYDEHICKYEVEKAIKWTEYRNITSWMYKKRDAWPYDKVNIDSLNTIKTIAEELNDCLPKSDMASKAECDQLISQITNFDECAEAGFPILESYPEQCQTPDGRTFVKR